MMARTLYAAGLSLKVVVQSVALSFLLALVLGGIAGYAYGHWPDHAISWIISLLYTVPFILIVVAVFAVVEPGIERAYIVIGCIGWASPARLVRAEVMQLRSSQFILAEKAYGYSEPRILLRTIIPRSFLPALLSLLYYIPELIGIEVGLSFFGLGAQPPTPSLGRLIYDGLSEIYIGWWLTMIPATFLLILLSAIYQATQKLSRLATTVRSWNE
jgi:peptide/nickel transport system permease protein